MKTSNQLQEELQTRLINIGTAVIHQSNNMVNDISYETIKDTINVMIEELEQLFIDYEEAKRLEDIAPTKSDEDSRKEAKGIV